MNSALPILISQEIQDKFKLYESILRCWNRRTFLVQENTLTDFYNRHILDSLQIIPFIYSYFSSSNMNLVDSTLPSGDQCFRNPNQIDPSKSDKIHMVIDPYPAFDSSLSLNSLPQFISHLSILDIGSGAGFPGMILALCGFEQLVLCDSNYKKCLFLQELARELDIDVTIINDRVENLETKFDVVTSRAFSSLSLLLQIFSNVSRETNSLGVFLKGQNIKREIIDAKSIMTNKYYLYQSLTNPEGSIFCIAR